MLLRAAFESLTGIRGELAAARFATEVVGRTTEPPMQQLMDAIAADRGMNATDLAAAHAIREFRNDIIHEGVRLARYTFAYCLRCLGSYLRWLPQTW